MLKAFRLMIVPFLITVTCYTLEINEQTQATITKLLNFHATDIGPSWRNNASQAREYTALVIAILNHFTIGTAFLKEQTEQKEIRLLILALALQQADCTKQYFVKEKDGATAVHLRRKDTQEKTFLSTISEELFGKTEKEALIIDQEWLKRFLDEPDDQLEKCLTNITRLSFN